jgi:hypothetical protein
MASGKENKSATTTDTDPNSKKTPAGANPSVTSVTSETSIVLQKNSIAKYSIIPQRFFACQQSGCTNVSADPLALLAQSV